MKKAARGVLLLMGMLLGSAAHAGKVTYIYTDLQGTPVMESDAQGNITARYDYTPYGIPVQGLSGSPDGPGYTGHVNDPDTGFVYMQARFYELGGRMLTPDPIKPTSGDIFNFNRYVYGRNNPMGYIDPTGMNACGNDSDAGCKVVISISDRTTDAKGSYNDGYTKVTNQKITMLSRPLR